MLHGRAHKYTWQAEPNQIMKGTKWKSLCAATRQIQISWHIHFRPCFRLHTIRVASFILDFLHLSLLLRLCSLLFGRVSFVLSTVFFRFFFLGAWMLCSCPILFIPFFSFGFCEMKRENIFSLLSLSQTENVFLSLCLANKSKIFHICEHCVLCGGT